MSTKILSFSLSEDEAKNIDRLAKEKNRSRSQIIKDAITLYSFESKWEELRKVGDIISKNLGLESDDDVEELLG